MGEPPPGPGRGAEAEPGSVLCRLQFLEDSDPFSCAAFPEPRRAPAQPVVEALPLLAQLPAMHRLLAAPLPVSRRAGVVGREPGEHRVRRGLPTDQEPLPPRRKELGFQSSVEGGREGGTAGYWAPRHAACEGAVPR